jgi:CRISPR-associated protein Cas5t
MRVLKVVLEGITTSFRYPHFMLGVQPSFPMPPPSTIYGHICSTMGEWVDPKGLSFAYHFTAQGSVEDLEHIHVLSASIGKLPQSRHPKVLEGNINPFTRTLLFQPRLILYINRPEWSADFRSPRYAVVLGRSQDLCSYVSVKDIDLVPSSHAYLEHTLLPYRMATQTPAGVATLMPRWIDYENGRRPNFAQYIVLQRRITTDSLMVFPGMNTQFLTDPSEPLIKDTSLGLVFHTFIGTDNEAVSMASSS